MTENNQTPRIHQQKWIRGLYMLVMLIAIQLTGTLVFMIAAFQFITTVLNDKPNDRMTLLGRGLGAYLQQIVNFLIFSTEKIPFPFNDWPKSE